MQGEIKTFQHVLKARESAKETEDRRVTGAMYVPVVVNPCVRHCFKSESSDSNLHMPWTRWVSLLPHYLLSINKWSPSSSFWVKFHSKVEVGIPGPLVLLAQCLNCRTIVWLWAVLKAREPVRCVWSQGRWQAMVLSGLSRPLPWEATVYPASIHKAEFGNQWYKQKGLVVLYLKFL